MECPNCNKTYDDEFNFCPWCGEEKIIQSEKEINIENSLEYFKKENKKMEEEFKNIIDVLNSLQENIKEYEEGNVDIEEKLKVSSSKIICPHCGSAVFISDYDRGEEVCARCGLVLKEHLLDMGKPWLYTNEKNSKEHLRFY